MYEERKPWGLDDGEFGVLLIVGGGILIAAIIVVVQAVFYGL